MNTDNKQYIRELIEAGEFNGALLNKSNFC